MTLKEAIKILKESNYSIINEGPSRRPYNGLSYEERIERQKVRETNHYDEVKELEHDMEVLDNIKNKVENNTRHDVGSSIMSKILDEYEYLQELNKNFELDSYGKEVLDTFKKQYLNACLNNDVRQITYR